MEYNNLLCNSKHPFNISQSQIAKLVETAAVNAGSVLVLTLELVLILQHWYQCKFGSNNYLTDVLTLIGGETSICLIHISNHGLWFIIFESGVFITPNRLVITRGAQNFFLNFSLKNKLFFVFARDNEMNSSLRQKSSTSKQNHSNFLTEVFVHQCEL